MYQSVIHLLLNTIEKYADKVALKSHFDGPVKQYTYRQFGEMIEHLMLGMRKYGLNAGDKIAILSNNRPEWTIADFAVFALRGIAVPIYPTLIPKQIAYILNDSETRAIFVEDKVQYDKISQVKDQIPSLEYIFSFSRIEQADKGCQTFEQLLEEGKSYVSGSGNAFTDSMKEIQPSQVCSFVYTSGTTGEPKGVMLNHKGFIRAIISAEAVINLNDQDIFLSFLPLSHLYERLGGHWCAFYRGATVHYARSIDTVVDDIAIAKPTIIVSVPRLYEKIMAAVLAQVESGSAVKRKIFYWALATGRSYYEQKHRGKISAVVNKKFSLANRLVFHKIKDKMGGRLRIPISGGAPLTPETLKFFEAMDMPIIEGYGMTETHLIITLTPLGASRYGSCGKPIEGVSIKIAEDGEILVKGDTLMTGYYKKEDLTRDMIDNEGWLHTGDIGFLDEDKFLYITDRKKNIIVTSGGKNIAPAPIENEIKKSIYIDDLCLIGNGRKFISALIMPNYDALCNWAAGNNITVSNNTELVNDYRVHELMEGEVERLQADFANYEKVKKFHILAEPLSIDKDQLTPSLKIKRKVVEQHFAAEIDRMYEL
jgi:long-chain acyl-CoA synthetase